MKMSINNKLKEKDNAKSDISCLLVTSGYRSKCHEWHLDQGLPGVCLSLLALSNISTDFES